MKKNVGFLINNLCFSGAERVFSILVNSISQNNPSLRIVVFLLDDKIKFRIDQKVKVKILGLNRNNFQNTISIYKQSRLLKYSESINTSASILKVNSVFTWLNEALYALESHQTF